MSKSPGPEKLMEVKDEECSESPTDLQKSPENKVGNLEDENTQM